MSFGIDTAKLKKIVELYAPNNHAEEMKYMLHLRGQEELFINLQTCPFQGISNDSLSDRQTAFGKNQLEFKQSSIGQPLFFSLSKPIIYVPVVFSMLVFTLQALKIVGDQSYKTVLLLLVSILNWLIHSSEALSFRLRTAKAARNLEQTIIEVIRENTTIQVESRDIVVGDVVLLQPDVVIPADGWVIEGDDIIVSQPFTAGTIQLCKNPFRRCLTKLKEKMQGKVKGKKIVNEQSPVLVGGSIVKQGEGRMVVLCVGSNTKQGKLLQYSQLTHHINHALLKIQALCQEVFNNLTLCLFLFFALFCLKSIYKASKSSWNELLSPRKWQQLMVIPWTLVLGIPQGLQLGLLIGLWVIKARLWFKESIWVNSCYDIVKMASIDLLCFDKCQQKETTVYKEWWNEQNHQRNLQTEQAKNIETEQVDLQLQEDICEQFRHLFEVVHIFKQCRQPQQYSTELLISDQQEQSDWRFVEQQVSESSVHYIVQNQAVKYVIYIDESRSRGFVLGCAEDILQNSSNFISKSTGEVSQLSTAVANQIKDIISSMSRRLMCSLGIGYFTVKQTQDPLEHRLSPLHNRELTFLCLLGASGMKEHSQYKIVKDLKEMGLKLMLVSDCPLQQAQKRARQIGVNTVQQDTIALIGHEFNKLVQGLHCKLCKKTMCVCTQKKDTFTIKNAEELRKAERFLRVMGQASAQQKYCLQLGMQSIGSLSAYIGSLPQDIPAMSKCYLSITSKIQLSQVAGVVLPKYDFRLLYELICWSRFSHQFTSKAVQLALPASLVPVIILLVGVLACGQLVFQLIPLVWTVAFLCPLLTVALSLQKTQPQLLKQKQCSYNKSSRLLSWSIKKQVFSQLLWQVLILLVVMFTGHLFIPQSTDSMDQSIGFAKYSDTEQSMVANGLYSNPLLDTPSFEPIYMQYHLYSRHLTVVYNLYTLMQIFNCLNCRKIKDTSINILQGIGFPTAILISVTFFSHLLLMHFCCQYIGLYPEPLTVRQWFICLGLAMSVCLVSFAARLLPQQKSEINKGKPVNRCTSLAVKSTQKLKQFSDFQVEQGIQFSQR